MKIDLHTHILPERWPDWTTRSGYPGWVELSHSAPGCACMLRSCADGSRTPFRDVTANCWDPMMRLEDCARHGVTTQVLSTVPIMFSYWAKPHHALDLSRLLNDHIAGIIRDFPNHFSGLGTVPMQDPALAIQELERCVNDLALPGIQIGSHIERPGQPDWNLSDPAVFEVLKAAAALNACVFVHPWDMMGSANMPKYWLPWLVGMPAETCRAICSVIFGGVLDRLPNLRIGFAHGGGSFPGTLGRIEHGFQVRPDLVAVDSHLSPSHSLGRFYVDSLVHDAAALRHIIHLFGADRVALGSDYPFPLGEDRPGTLIESLADELGPGVAHRLLAGTAREFLGQSQAQSAPKTNAQKQTDS